MCVSHELVCMCGITGCVQVCDTFVAKTGLEAPRGCASLPASIEDIQALGEVLVSHDCKHLIMRGCSKLHARDTLKRLLRKPTHVCRILT
jgi:hypothetical protein